MFRFSARPVVRLALILPCLLALGSCGGSDTGAIITVPNSVIIADLRGNGLMDVVVVAAQIDETGLTQKPGLMDVALNSSPPGNFGVGTLYETSSSPPSGLAVGDLTGTGTHDLVVTNINAGTVSVFKETSPTSGTYAQAVTVTVGGQPNDVQVADINGDGLPDLIVADNTGAVEYLLQNPASPGTFEAPVKMLLPQAPSTSQETCLAVRGIAVAVGDLNGDGLPDLAVSTFDSEGDCGQLVVFFQDPSHPGTFLQSGTNNPTVIVAYGEPTQIRIADVNQDGDNDIIVACQGLAYYANPDEGTLTSPGYLESQYGAMVILQNSASPGTFGTPVVYPSVEGSLSLAIGDLNGDGLPDLAMSSLITEGAGAIATLNQDPSNPGTFVPGWNSTGSGQPASIAIGDLNGDGLPDIVVADSTSAVWYENLAATPGSFGLETQIGSFDQ